MGKEAEDICVFAIIGTRGLTQ